MTSTGERDTSSKKKQYLTNNIKYSEYYPINRTRKTDPIQVNKRNQIKEIILQLYYEINNLENIHKISNIIVKLNSKLYKIMSRIEKLEKKTIKGFLIKRWSLRLIKLSTYNNKNVEWMLKIDNQKNKSEAICNIS